MFVLDCVCIVYTHGYLCAHLHIHIYPHVCICVCVHMILASISEAMILMGRCSIESNFGVLCVGNGKEHCVLEGHSEGSQDLCLGT